MLRPERATRNQISDGNVPRTVTLNPEFRGSLSSEPRRLAGSDPEARTRIVQIAIAPGGDLVFHGMEGRFECGSAIARRASAAGAPLSAEVSTTVRRKAALKDSRQHVRFLVPPSSSN